MIKRDELIKIGQFNKPHGLSGELAFTFTDDVFDRTECPYIVCEIDGIFVPFFLEEYRFRTDSTALVKLIDIDSAEDGRMFTNLDVYFPKAYVREEEAMQGGKDFFLNYKVMEETHGYLGNIVEVDDATANVLFVIENEDDEQLLVPAVDEFVTNIDEKNKVIYLKLPEGLIE
ncbi:MAG: ribosome maturation factor RimM [Bacteroidales bacterium]